LFEVQPVGRRSIEEASIVLFVFHQSCYRAKRVGRALQSTMSRIYEKILDALADALWLGHKRVNGLKMEIVHCIRLRRADFSPQGKY
jgi:hypothetical protein